MKRISVKGYKAINNEKKLDFAPINLLIGPNGSGKSSIINSLVLTKKMFVYENKQHNYDFKFGKNIQPNDILNKAIFEKFNYSHKFSNYLLNPNDVIGKFSNKDINSNKKSKEFSITLPIELSFFPEEFNMELTYYLKEDNHALLSRIRVINLSNNAELFSLQSDDLEITARKKEETKKRKF